MDLKNVEELTAAYPELTAQIVNNAVAAERKRIQDIEGMALDGFEEIIAKAKYESPSAASDVAMQIIAAQKKQGANYLAGVNDDVQNSGVNEIKPSVHEGADDKVNPYDAAIDKILPIQN